MPSPSFWRFDRFSVVMIALILTVGFALTGFYYFKLKKYEDDRLQEVVQSAGLRISNEISSRLEARILSLSRLAKRWEIYQGLSKSKWAAEARLQMEHYSGYESIQWADSNFKIRWTEPTIEKVLNMDLRIEEKRRKAALEAYEMDRTVMTSPIDLMIGGKGFLALSPIRLDKKFQGLVVGVFRFESLMSSILPPRQVSGFHVSISVDDSDVFNSKAQEEDQHRSAVSDLTLSEFGTQWRIQIRPTEETIDSVLSPLPAVAAVSGFILTILFAASVFLLRTSRQKHFELAKANDQLEERVRIRTLELQLAKQAADSASNAKSEFLANMSHEIRTPLGVILGYAELLYSEIDPTPEQKSFFEAIHRNGELLKTVIGDILDLSKVESGRAVIEKSSVSFLELLKDIETVISFKTREQKIDFVLKMDPDLPEWITTDSDRLKQIIINVAGNAVKFTEKGFVEIHAKWILGADQYRRIAFVVKDTGIGIDPSQAHQLFVPFNQLDSKATRKFGGTGLGLALSKKLAQALGGDIHLAESALGVGSTFILTFDPTPYRMPVSPSLLH